MSIAWASADRWWEEMQVEQRERAERKEGILRDIVEGSEEVVAFLAAHPDVAPRDAAVVRDKCRRVQRAAEALFVLAGEQMRALMPAVVDGIETRQRRDLQ